MSTSDGPQGTAPGSEASEPTPQGRSPLSFLLAAIPLGLVVVYQFGFVGMLLRLAPVLVFGGAWRLLPLPVRVRPWAIWMFLLGGIGGALVVDIVLALQ